MIVHKTQTANRDRPFEWSSFCRWLSPPTADFRLWSFFTTCKRYQFENDESWTKNVKRTPIAIRGQPVDWSCYLS
jgi:hypothetical protein